MTTALIDPMRRRLLLATGATAWVSGASLLCGSRAQAAARTDPRVRETGPASLLLASEWTRGADPTGWLVSEKFDGVRALWDGQKLRFRSGREIAAPGSFLARLPAQPLDGELWLARGRFDELSGLVRRAAPYDAGWQALRYLVFELPDAPGAFAQRAQALQAIVKRVGWTGLQAVDQQPVASAAALQHCLDDVVRLGGEGLMLHRADAAYVTGRSALLCKLKPLSDAEAVVVAHQPGRGALAGQTGALRVRTADGRVFDVGTGLGDAQRRQPPAIGTKITYAYSGLTGSGLPRFASYLREAPVF